MEVAVGGDDDEEGQRMRRVGRETWSHQSATMERATLGLFLAYARARMRVYSSTNRSNLD